MRWSTFSPLAGLLPERTTPELGAEAVLKLRAVRTNGDFDRYWHFHLTRENHRIHTPRYQDTCDLAA